MSSEQFVFAVDLDGVVADFYGRMREIVAEWRDVPVDRLAADVEYGLKSWGVADEDEYHRIHRFAVTHRDLFSSLKPIQGAGPALRRLSNEGVRIRIVTYRLFEGVKHVHERAIVQTVRWLGNVNPDWPHRARAGSSERRNARWSRGWREQPMQAFGGRLPVKGFAGS